MMAVPFTFRSSTPHVPGEGRSSFATLHEEVGADLQGPYPHTALALPFRSIHIGMGCMQCFKSKHKQLFILIFLFFSSFPLPVDQMWAHGSENCDPGYHLDFQIVRTSKQLLSSYLQLGYTGPPGLAHSPHC